MGSKPTRTLLVCLGGSAYPDAPDLRHEAFAGSSQHIRDMLVVGKAKIVDETDYLDLFDSGAWWPAQLIELREWVERERLRGGVAPASDLIIHYVGHGAFRDDAEYYLTINRTDARDPFETSLTLSSLYRVISRIALHMRVYILLDACFAAASLKDMQIDAASSAVAAKVRGIMDHEGQDAAASAGIAILCSSDKFSTSSARGRGGVTQFTDGLLTVVEEGDASAGQFLSFDAVAKLLRSKLRKHYGPNAVIPILHAPETKQGQISPHPLIPNRAISDAGVLLDGLDDVAKAKLEERVNVFVKDLTDTASDEMAFEKRVDAVRVVGEREERELLALCWRAEELRRRALNYRAGSAMEVARSKVLSRIDAANAVLEVPLRIRLPFGERATTEWWAAAMAAADAARKEGAQDLQMALDGLLMLNAEIETVRADLLVHRGRLIQMAHLALTLQARLTEVAGSLQRARADRLRTRAIAAAGERLHGLMAALGAAEQESDRLLTEKDADADLFRATRALLGRTLVQLSKGLGVDPASPPGPLAATLAGAASVRSRLAEWRDAIESLPTVFPS